MAATNALLARIVTIAKVATDAATAPVVTTVMDVGTAPIAPIAQSMLSLRHIASSTTGK